MRLRTLRQIGAVAMTTALGLGAVPSLADSLTDSVVKGLRQADPGISLNTVDENQLQLSKQSKSVVVNLDNLRRSCRLDASGCARDTQALVKTSLELLAPAAYQTHDARQLRVVIRSQDYVDDMTRLVNEERKVPTRFLYKALSDKLVALVVVDTPTAVSPLDEDSLRAMALTPQAAWDLAISHNFEILKATELNPLDTNVLGLGGSFFSPAWLLSAHWEKFTRENAVNVAWACVYDADQAIFAYNDPAKLRTMQRGCPVWVGKAKRPVSERLMVWKKDTAQWATLH